MVVKDVPDNTVIVCNPAKIIKYNESKDKKNISFIK